MIYKKNPPGIVFLTIFFLLFGSALSAQTVSQKLQSAFAAFEKDSQLKYAISSLYVIDANTGQVVFDKNSRIGLAPASTQKIITSVTAFEVLGKNYRYETKFGFDKKDRDLFYILPTGDPTFGSWRWPATTGDSIIAHVQRAVGVVSDRNKKRIVFDNSGWDAENIPDGWIWQDIGNYYGAGAGKFNYRENQYDILLRSGKSIGDPVTVASINPLEASYLKEKLDSKLSSASRGSGDNAYVYLPGTNGPDFKIRGSIPVNENSFSISASMIRPEEFFINFMAGVTQPEAIRNFQWTTANVSAENAEIIYTHYSPALDSIIYWFNKKSVNLYGEALIKSMAFSKKGKGTTDDGVKVVKDFWKQKGIDDDELNIVDGSGLSPQNRVTTHAQVEILKYAKKNEWFPAFLNSLPEYNNMSMKSGTIRGVKGFCGYHKARSGKEYIFSFLVNNYNGSPSALVSKMYRVLDNLK